MKIRCVLYGRKSCKPLTETEISKYSFLGHSDNPFPASELTSFAACEDQVTAIYTVRKLHDYELRELEAA